MKAASSREFYEVSLGLTNTINTCNFRCHAACLSNLVMILKLYIPLCIIPYRMNKQMTVEHIKFCIISLYLHVST
jgi:hypothetical protein